MQIEVMYLNPVREKPRCHEVGRGGYKKKSGNWGKGSLILFKKSLLNFFWHSIAQTYLEVLTNYLDLIFILFNFWIDL